MAVKTAIEKKLYKNHWKQQRKTFSMNYEDSWNREQPQMER